MSITARYKPFAISNRFVEPAGISEKLVAFAGRQLVAKGMKLTQSAIADFIGVSQPMIHSVAYRTKDFSEQVYRSFAEKNGMTYESLMCELLSIKTEEELDSVMREIRRNPRRPSRLCSIYMTVPMKR